jgi:hypothetical protein
MELDNEIYVIDDVIPVTYQNHILDKVTSLQFPWYFNTNLVSNEEQLAKDEENIQGFNHFLYEEQKAVSPFFESIYPLYLSIADKSPVQFNMLERMRFNLTHQNKYSKLDWHMPHIDSLYPHYIAIYYVNDSDGDTFIFNESNPTFEKDFDEMQKNNFTVRQRVTPKKGRVVIFPGHTYHASSFARESKFRCVVNINLGLLF